MALTTSKVAALESWLSTQQVTMGDEWVQTLEERKQEEAQFHDADREGHRDEAPVSTPNRRFYEAAGVVRDYIDQWMHTATPGTRFLDYACGNGRSSIQAARNGAALVVGIDISATSVRNSAESARQAGVAEVCHFLQRDCEDTKLRAESFDAALCCGMLHHLDLERAFPELHRVMAPGGRILCVEALAYNPAIRLYRKMTPTLRTQWETDHILGMRDVKLAGRWFGVENMRFWLMAAPLMTLLPAGGLRRAGIAAGHAVDTFLTRVPLLRLWAWQFTFELVKKA